MPFISLHKYRSVYENHRLFRKPPLLGPPLSCANTCRAPFKAAPTVACSQTTTQGSVERCGFACFT